MPAWPATLPAPLLDGYSLKTDSRLRRTEMESGPAKQRRVATSGPTAVSLSWVFNRQQYAVFAAWFHHIVADGQEWFDMTLRTAQGENTVRVRFKETPTERYTAPHWRVEASCEIESIPLMTPAELAPYL